MFFIKTSRPKIRVEIYSKPECHLCDEAKMVLQRVQSRLPFELIEVDIAGDQVLYQEYKEQIPVIFINGLKAFKFRVDEKELIRKIRSA